MAKKKHRSPSYPAISLRAAITLAEKIYPAAVKHSLGGDVIAKEWKYKGLSSAAPHVAALKYYGLLVEEKSEGDDRMLRLSTRAADILVDPDGETRERIEAIQEAALTPTLHKELWDKWGGVPPEAEIRRHLVRDRGFNPNRVDTVIGVFRDTITFAKLITPDIIDHTSRSEDNHIGGSEMDTLANETRDSSSGEMPFRSSSGVAPSSAGAPFISFPLSGGNVIEISLRSKCSREDFDTVKRLVDLSEPALVDSGGDGEIDELESET